MNNFLGVAGGAAAGGALAGAISGRGDNLAGDRAGFAHQPTRDRAERPQERANWQERSQNRNEQWQQRVDTRSEAWNQRSDQRQQARSDFQQNREQRWNQLDQARDDRQSWRDQNREDWQKHREDLWDYRGDRAEEIWDNARDFYDDVFDDRWWGQCGWAVGWVGYYPSNPWWWWTPVTYETTVTYIEGLPPEPTYIDYGMNVVYEGDTVYVDNQAVPAEEYSQPMIDMATSAPPQPPPMPPAPAKAGQNAATSQSEWLPLGVFALAQEEKGDPVMFFQISVNRAGAITGGYKSTIANDQRSISGQIDKKTQRAAWRIGENKDTIFVTSVANLTQDVSPITLHFGKNKTQTWLLVRMPEPAGAGQPQKLPKAPEKAPPLKTPQK